MSRFFVSCAPGFEQDLFDEMKSFWFEMMDLDGKPTRSLLTDYEMKLGGVEIEVADHLGFQINLFSKIANRVLIRIHRFEARFFDQFEKEFKKMDWDQLLDVRQVVLKIETHKSRINNQNSIEESMTKMFKEKKFKVLPTSTEEPIDTYIKIYLRIEKDRVTISLDTSGEHLHRRGYSVYRGEAPLRETFAAYVLKQLQRHTGNLNGGTLIDPFAGAGTFLFEAQSEFRPNLKRFFSMAKIKSRPKLLKSDTWMQNYNWLSADRGVKCFAIDQDPKASQNIEKNQTIFNEMFPSLKSHVNVTCGDSLKVDLETYRNLPGLCLVANPPYGHRLAEGSAVQILERFEKELPLKAMAVLHPESWNFHFQKLKLVQKTDFSNQGLKLKLSIFSTPS